MSWFVVRYMKRKSARSLRVWLVHWFVLGASPSGRYVGFRLFGWTVLAWVKRT